MDKLKMAHEVACAMINNGCSMHTAIADAWRYADEMQAEADKRKPMVQSGYVGPIKSSVGGVVSNEYWWTDRDEKGNCLHNKKSFGGISCLSCKQLLTPDFLRGDKLEGFSLDWSSAPDWAVAWTMDEGETLWWSVTPYFKNGFWFLEDSASWKCSEAPSFNYTGAWHDSLRKRPQEDKQ